MAIYEPDISTDPAELEQIAFDYLRGVLPGWEPSEADPMTWLIRAHAQMIAEERDVAADVPAAIFRFLGEQVHRIPPTAATAASVSATFTMRDSAGYTIPGGLEVLVRTAGDDGVTFSVVAPVTVPPGSTATAAGEVTLVAMSGFEGTLGNGLSGDNDAVVIRAEAQYQSVELVGVSAGGADAETDDEYLTRLAEELTLTSPIPVLPADFAALARRHPAVGRALALNLYDPVARTTDNERMVTVVVADSAGEPVGRTVRTEVQATLEAMRELNWRCPVIDPTYTSVDVAFEATAWAGFDPAEVQAAALAAVTAALSPAAWGAGPAQGEQPDWIDDPKVRYLEVAQVLNEVPGLRYVTRLTINLTGGGSPGTADLTLAGPGPLPRPGTITGTVTGG